MTEDADIVEFDEIVALALASAAQRPGAASGGEGAADGSASPRRRIRPASPFTMRPTIAGCRIRCPASG